MSVSATLSAFQTVHAGITGVTSAPTALPGALNDANLPTVITWPGEARWEEQAVGLPKQVRTYLVRCYVAAVAQGEGVDEGFQSTVTLIQRFGEKYLDGLAAALGVDQAGDSRAGGVRDGGVTVLDYAGVTYHGFEFKLEVVEK